MKLTFYGSAGAKHTAARGVFAAIKPPIPNNPAENARALDAISELGLFPRGPAIQDIHPH